MTASFYQLLRPKTLKLSLTPLPLTPHIRSFNKSFGSIFKVREFSYSSPLSQLPSWFIPPSFLGWVFAGASPCFLSSSPAVCSLREAKASVSLIFSEPSRASPLVQTKTQSPYSDLLGLAWSGPITLLTLSPLPFPSLCSSHFLSCVPLACLTVLLHPHQLGMNYR